MLLIIGVIVSLYAMSEGLVPAAIFGAALIISDVLSDAGDSISSRLSRLNRLVERSVEQHEDKSSS